MVDIPICEEIQVKCVGCGKKIKVVRYSGSKDEDFLCQKCSGAGSGGEEDDTDDG